MPIRDHATTQRAAALRCIAAHLRSANRRRSAPPAAARVRPICGGCWFAQNAVLSTVIDHRGLSSPLGLPLALGPHSARWLTTA